MPTEIKDIEKFIDLSDAAKECRVKRTEEIVKLKLRTPHRLYTIKLDASEAGEALKRIKCEVVEI